AHSGEPARDHLAVIEVGNIGKARAFGKDQANDRAAPRLDDFLDEISGKAFDQRANRSATLWRRGETADQRQQGGPHQFLKQRLLVLEVQINRALGDARALRHVVESCRGVAAFDELIERSVKNSLTSISGAFGAILRALVRT